LEINNASRWLAAKEGSAAMQAAISTPDGSIALIFRFMAPPFSSDAVDRSSGDELASTPDVSAGRTHRRSSIAPGQRTTVRHHSLSFLV
jgi:hypothetical protein